MPKFIGRKIEGATQITDNAVSVHGHVRLTYAQARKIPAQLVKCSLDTTDKGSKHCKAKRWFRWFAPVEMVVAFGTPKMVERAWKSDVCACGVAGHQ